MAVKTETRCNVYITIWWTDPRVVVETSSDACI